MNIGPMITMLRKEIGMTQAELAEYLSLSTGTISNYENGVHYPDLVTINKLADLFHVTTDFLLERTKYRCPPEILEQYRTEDSEISNLTNRYLNLTPHKRQSVEDYMEYLATNKPDV